MTHTPGPWKLSESASRCILGKSNGGGWMTVCVVQNTQSEHYEANARLIAAAPDLLEAAKDLLAAKDKTNQSLRDALAKAIAKAEGR